MHMSFKKGLVIAMTAGLLGTNGLHAKASDSLEQAETAVCQTENITFPTTNGVLRTSGLFTPVQNTEEEDTSIIVEETVSVLCILYFPICHQRHCDETGVCLSDEHGETALFPFLRGND